MRDILEAVAAGELSPGAAEARLRGYATARAGRFDAARERRSGVPEAVLASGKTPGEVASLVTTSVETTGRAIATRLDDRGVAAVRRRLDEDHPDASVRLHDRAGVLVDVPVVGLPVSTGYGHGGGGEAALAGMLQSCTALSVVNIDAGFTAGAQAGLVARRLDAARSVAGARSGNSPEEGP